MKSLSQYLRQPHAVNCDCSVCWLSRNWVPPKAPTYPYIQCTDCRPAQWSKVNGRNHVTQAYTCERHKPGNRPLKYWSVVFQSATSAPTDDFPF
ncbi:lysogeny maintenance protein PflM [Ectopseudomonas oleovorans]|uniref:lysogeny maintenance protein PflM n=1 Tax=Ectopseudomonas oleovorans TaxID=301 RepID=UPI00163A8ECF